MRNITIVFFISIFIFLYILNYLTPLSFGDDYLYAFIWQGNSMFVPLREDAVRISSWQDLIVSQWSLYFTWGGRVVGQLLTQFFVWLGKDIFNVSNAFVGTLLIAELNWCMNKGKVSMSVRPAMIIWTFFVLWLFAPGFSDVFIWLTGSCIFLWPAVFLLSFLVPYVQKYYAFQDETEKSCYYDLAMFFLGLLAGCGNENSVCWVILALFIFLFTEYKKGKKKETWMFTGVVGLVFGYAILMLAPGNLVRLHSGHGSNWFSLELLMHHFSILVIVLLFQAFLWFFCLKSIYRLRRDTTWTSNIQKDILLVKVLLLAALGMSAIMLFSPEYPTRSGFPGTLPLVIATGILLRIQKENHIELIQCGAKKALASIGILFFLISSSVTVYNYYEKYIYMQKILADVDQFKQSSQRKILCVQPFRTVSFEENLISGLHIPNYALEEVENNWKNVAFARYYGIQGVIMVKQKGE